MFILTHAALGALIAAQVPESPALGFSLAFIAHFFSDMIPHGDTAMFEDYQAGKNVKKAVALNVIDGALATILGVLLIALSPTGMGVPLAFGIVGGILPDVIVAGYELMKWRWLKWFYQIHFFFHNFISHRKDVPYLVGAGVQLAILPFIILWTW